MDVFLSSNKRYDQKEKLALLYCVVFEFGNTRKLCNAAFISKYYLLISSYRLLQRKIFILFSNQAEIDDIFGEFDIDEDYIVKSKEVLGLFVAQKEEEKKVRKTDRQIDGYIYIVQMLLLLLTQYSSKENYWG